MPRGFKVFDVYGELHLDKDEVRQALRSVPGEMGADADRAGQELGRKMTDGLARSVEASSARLAKARRAEQNATDAVKLAEVRLSEARDKGVKQGSTLLALEQKLEQAQRRLADSQSNTVTSTKKLEDAQRRLASSMGDVDKDLGPRAQKSGEDAGGKLALGMRMSVIRNSPLIVAAIGAGLAAGGPLMMSAATGLFAGVGIVAAAQSQKVQSAWLGTWQRVKQGAIADAAVIEPVLVRVASQVGDAFERMRPRLRDTFSAAAPQIEVFTRGVLGLAENALPGLERAVQRGMPVTQGLAAFLEKTGTGLSSFFDRISEHAPAAGQVWSQLGDTMATLLPTLGELIGQGSELAADVLPLVNSTLGLTLKVATALGPALPPIVAGFMAMKAVGAVTGILDGLGGRMDGLVTKWGSGAEASTRFTTAASAIGRVLGPIGVAIGVVTAGIENQNNRINSWAEALLKGGAAAREARAEMEKAPGPWDRFSDAITHGGNSLGVVERQQRQAKDAADALFHSMDPLAQAQSKVAEWTATLSDRLGDENATTAEVEAAKRRLAYWAEQEAIAQGQLEAATNGVTAAMVAQTDQAMAAIDSGFAYQHSINQLEDAQTTYNEAVRDHGAASEEATRALLDLEEQNYRVAQSFGQQQADLSGLKQGTDEYTRYVQEQTLAKLYDLKSAAGPEMAASLQQQISMLEASGVSLSNTTVTAMNTAARMRDLGLSVTQVPGFKGVNIDAPTADQAARIAALGYQVVTMPDGSIYVAVSDADARARLAALTYRRTVDIVANFIGSFPRAAGGPVIDSPIFAAVGRKVVGPGGPTEDRVPAIGPGGASYRLSPGEWITNAMVSRQQGDGRMALLNAGKADIVPRVAPLPRSAGSTPSFPLNPVTGSGQSNGGTQIHIGSVSLVIPGAFNLGSGTDKLRLVRDIRDELVKLERSDS